LLSGLLGMPVLRWLLRCLLLRECPEHPGVVAVAGALRLAVSGCAPGRYREGRIARRRCRPARVLSLLRRNGQVLRAFRHRPGLSVEGHSLRLRSGFLVSGCGLR
jgi:hypothetical protein